MITDHFLAAVADVELVGTAMGTAIELRIIHHRSAHMGLVIPFAFGLVWIDLERPSERIASFSGGQR